MALALNRPVATPRAVAALITTALVLAVAAYPLVSTTAQPAQLWPGPGAQQWQGPQGGYPQPRPAAPMTQVPPPAMQPPQQAIPATPQQRAPQQAAPQQLAPQQAAPVPQAQPAQRSGRPSPPALDRKESVEADVSTRSVAVTSSFTGTEIVIFGSVDNSRQQTAESGLYDIAIIVEGTETPVVARKKSNIAGLWINTQSANFSGVPSYYTITSTRPIEEIAETQVLSDNAIGFEHVGMTPSPETKLSAAELDEFKKAVVRRKQADNLYQKRDYGVVFIGRSLFRSTITLPANVPVGPLSARTFLFKDGKLLSSHTSKVSLQREGIERLLHSFAFDYPLLYGIFAVLTAVAAGLIASALFRRGSH